uniref:Uncharacterized protein n=1 Tax=Clytia hemisphaerica TaxID=252671 RepID=A0A7M5WQC7_9CNID
MAQQRPQIFALPPPPPQPPLPPQHRQPPLRQSPSRQPPPRQPPPPPLQPPPFFRPLMELPPPPPPLPPVGIYGLHHINVDHLNDVCVLRNIVRQLQTSGREDKNERRRLLRDLQDERTIRRNLEVEHEMTITDMRRELQIQQDTRPQDFQCTPSCPHCGASCTYYFAVKHQTMINSNLLDDRMMESVNRGSLF